MRRLSVFNNVSLDGYFVDAAGDMSWAHRQDPEWNEFVAANASGESVLLFGRVTYQMMASWWPTPPAMRSMPEVAERMNGAQKVVFSRTLERADWRNTTVVRHDLAGAVRRMKQEDGPQLVILGSGAIVAQLAQERLIDEYEIVVQPVVLGQGRTLFAGVEERIPLRLAKARTFGNGNVYLRYEQGG